MEITTWRSKINAKQWWPMYYQLSHIFVIVIAKSLGNRNQICVTSSKIEAKKKKKRKHIHKNHLYISATKLRMETTIFRTGWCTRERCNPKVFKGVRKSWHVYSQIVLQYELLHVHILQLSLWHVCLLFHPRWMSGCREQIANCWSLHYVMREVPLTRNSSIFVQL